MILRKILVTHKRRIADNGIEMSILSKLRLAICEEVSRFNRGSVQFIYCKNALYRFLRFIWIKLYTLRKMNYCFSLRATLDQSFYSRSKNYAITTTRFKNSSIRSLNSPVSEKISDWLWSVIAASKLLICCYGFHKIMLLPRVWYPGMILLPLQINSD